MQSRKDLTFIRRAKEERASPHVARSQASRAKRGGAVGYEIVFAVSAAESEFGRALRSLYEDGNRTWNEGNFERAYEVRGDDVEYELASTWPQARPLRGRVEVVKFFEDFRETFPDVRTGPPEFVEISERRMIVGFSVVGTGRASRVRIETEIWQVWELGEGGMPLRVTEYPDRNAAKRAARVAA
jgi:SnoaL-like domain